MHRLASLDKLACEEMIVYNLQALLMKKSSHFLKWESEFMMQRLAKLKLLLPLSDKRGHHLGIPFQVLCCLDVSLLLIKGDLTLQVFDTLFPSWSQSHTLFNPLTI